MAGERQADSASWDHSGDAADVIGWVAPASLREADEAIYVRGQLHLEDSESRPRGMALDEERDSLN